MKNIYVYDRRRFFFIFLKKKFSKEYNFIRLNSVEYMKIENFNSDDVAVFNAYYEFDIVAFFRFKECFENRILVCYEKNDVASKYKNTNEIEFIDISRPKANFYTPLKMRIDSLFRIGLK